MIQQLLISAIDEVAVSRFEISEFQLGRIPYTILKEELESI